ncbi:MAG: hypothetical protein ACK55Z_12065 [bacterium]
MHYPLLHNLIFFLQMKTEKIIRMLLFFVHSKNATKDCSRKRKIVLIFATTFLSFFAGRNSIILCYDGCQFNNSTGLNRITKISFGFDIPRLSKAWKKYEKGEQQDRLC